MNNNAPRNESQIAYHRRRLIELKSVRNPWEKTWRGLAEYIEPTRLRLDNKNEGPITREKIIDATGTYALRTLASGMHSGITSPARPWFRLATSDPELRDFAPVKTYLADVERRMREVFQGSNIYPSFHVGYGDLGQFGQSIGILVEDDDDTIRMQQLLHGRFWIARDEKGRVTTLYREFKWSVQRIIGRFGYKKVSRTIQNAYDLALYDDVFVICHAIEPRLNREPGKIDKANKPFLSNYWEEAGGDHGDLLEESGFDENPLISPAWELAGDDHYALSPGQIALGDVRMLQAEQKRKLEGIDKIVRPPMTGPTSLMNNPKSLLPGAITYADDPTGKGFRPAMEVNLRLSELAQDIRETQDRINRAFFADLFMMLSNMEGIQPRNQLELSQRNEEKLLQLGPVLENIYNGQLEPVIDRTYAIMNRRGMLPPPPPDLQDQELKIEYISMLAQAQKAVATGGLERLWGFAGQIASVKPEVLDKLDGDQSLDLYSDMLGVDPSAVIPDDDVAKVREARAQKQAAAENAAMAAQIAPAAKQSAEAASVLADAQNNPAGGELLARLGLN